MPAPPLATLLTGRLLSLSDLELLSEMDTKALPPTSLLLPQLQPRQLPPDPLTSSPSRHQASDLFLPPEAERDKRQPVEDQ